MYPVVTVDTSGIQSLQARLLDLIESESIKTVADTHRSIILGLTASGADAFGEIFHPYNEQYARERAREGYQTDVKNLRKTGGMLDSLGLVGDTLTVDDAHQKIALGQITGHSGDWGYVHDFLDTSNDSNLQAADDLAAHLQSEL